MTDSIKPKNRSKGGRPPVPAHLRRPHIVESAMTATELAGIRSAALKVDMAISAYVRKAVLHQVEKDLATA